MSFNETKSEVNGQNCAFICCKFNCCHSYTVRWHRRSIRWKYATRWQSPSHSTLSRPPPTGLVSAFDIPDRKVAEELTVLGSDVTRTGSVRRLRDVVVTWLVEPTSACSAPKNSEWSTARKRKQHKLNDKYNNKYFYYSFITAAQVQKRSLVMGKEVIVNGLKGQKQ